MSNIWKGHTMMTNGDWNGQTNHARRLELQEEMASAINQIKKGRNKRRNLRKKLGG